MKSHWKLAGLATLGTLAAINAPANAQEPTRPHSQELSIYGGQLFGDDLTDDNVAARKPKLDDDVTYGIRYAYTLTPSFALEAAVGRTPTSILNLAGGDADLDLTTLDLDAVWHFDAGNGFVPYVLAGAGYARAELDDPVPGLDDDEGFTLNAGVGAKYYVTDQFLVRLEAKYRYLDKVVEPFDDSVNTVETTLGVAWQF